MDKSLRINILKESLRKIESGEYKFICNAIFHSCYTNIHLLFPELSQFKPEEKSFNRVWWDDNEKGKQKRIEVLKELIKIIENE